MNGKKRGIGLSFALDGLKHIVKKEKNFKIHFCIAIIVVIISGLFKLTLIEWTIILLVISLVFITEIINSAIEHLIDYIKPEIHPKAKIIKDMLAGSVLICAIVAIIIGLIIFIPKFVSLL